MYQTEHPGYHLSLAKMDSAPSSSVVGIQIGNGSGSGAHGHLNSSGLKIIFAKNINTYDIYLSVLSFIRDVDCRHRLGILVPAQSSDFWENQI